MRYIILIILLVFISCGEEDANEYKKLYEKGDYLECIDLYESLKSNFLTTQDEAYYIGLSYNILGEPCNALSLFYYIRDGGGNNEDLNMQIERTEGLAIYYNCKFENKSDGMRLYYSKRFVQSYFDQYEFYESKNQLDSALLFIKAAIASKPNDASLYDRMSRVYLNLGLNDSALWARNIAISLEPDECVWIFNRGYTFSKIGDTTRAIADCETALKMDSSHCECYDFLIELLRSNKQIDQAKYWRLRKERICH
jgi:tetratricopeptide (TPR) repeat protein